MFPKWGFSYNALYVPLPCGNWHCGLMPEREVRNFMQAWNRFSRDHVGRLRPRNFGWSLWDDDDDSKEWMNNRIARDRQDFLQIFEVRIHRREAYMSHDFAEYVKFIDESLCPSAMRLPVDGKDITHVLKQAVRNGRLIPAIDREWPGNRAVFRHYAPQYWPASGGGGSGASANSDKVLTWKEFQALRQFNGELNGGNATASADFGAGVRSAGVDWLGEVVNVAADILPASDSEDDSTLSASFTDGDTPLMGEALEYEPLSSRSGLFQLAARGVSEADEAECFAAYERALEECRLYAGMTGEAYTYVACKAKAFTDYNRCRGY